MTAAEAPAATAIGVVVTVLGAAALWRGWRRRRATFALLACGLFGWAAHGVWSAGPVPSPWRWVPLALLGLAALITAGLMRRNERAARALQRMNTELGQRVTAQTAELHAALDPMRRARDAAEAADLAKTRFLAAASHDLRQPAHALGLYLAALRAGPLAHEQAEIAQRMGASLAALDTMFGSLLDVSRIDAGAVVPHWDLVPLAPLLRRLADEWAPEAEARGLRLALHVSDADAVSVSDPLLLERVLRNLLANAVKYTPSGGVLLACRLRHDVQGARHFRIEVWDSGVGIAPAAHERVFEEFYQVAGAARERHAGLGLGLAIVQRLVRLLQLRLVLHSRPGRGSVFMLEGLAPAGVLPQRAAAARHQMRRLQGTLVAVIDDDPQVRDATRRLLQLWGCEVADGADADALLAQLPQGAVPAALVADVRLAGERRGPDEAQRLFAAWNQSVPLLLVSGETAPGHDCLAKPVSPARLRAWLEQAVERGASAEMVPPATAPSAKLP